MPASWKPEVFVEKKWTENQLRFATQPEAATYAADLYSRWTSTEGHRATESDDPVNYKWVTGQGLVKVDTTADPAVAAE